MKRLAVFAHYDRDNEVKRYVTYLLRRLRSECDEIAFVSTAALPDAEIEKVRPYCATWWLKENVGFDFGMWTYAFERIDMATVGELVLVNSSVLGPIKPLRPIFRHMDASDCDVWAITDNVDMAWHLQSYFLVFKERALRSDAFAAFWKSVLPYKDKSQTIRSYEVGLTRFLLDAGLKLVSYVSVAPDPLMPKFTDATRLRPMESLRMGAPFVKVALLRANPAGVPLAPVYRAMELAGYDMSLVEFVRRRAERR